MTNRDRKYPPGSSWLYVRLYGGPQALESWLASWLADSVDAWKGSGMVIQFHYLHYLDPDYHLRLRFNLPDPDQSGKIMREIQDSCAEMLEEDQVWKIETGTYEPEYERYGFDRMPAIEKLFEMDSLFWLSEIRRCLHHDDPDIWKTALRSIDILFNDFGVGIADKISIIKRLRDSAIAVSGFSRSMKGQLDAKYRILSGEIARLLDNHADKSGTGLSGRSIRLSVVVNEIRDSYENLELLYASDLLPDLIHMSLNRAFRTRHRMQELVIYDFLGRYYDSANARRKSG